MKARSSEAPCRQWPGAPRAHFAGHDGGVERDPVEIWGKRIGRGLSLVGFVALAIYLYATYVK